MSARANGERSNPEIEIMHAQMKAEVKERPILFSGPMVRAILDDRKTQTRRVVKLPKWSTQDFEDFDPEEFPPLAIGDDTGCFAEIPTPYGKPGDHLWVRETWLDGLCNRSDAERASREDVYYRADGEAHEQFEDYMDVKWKPSIFMPRWASRINLEITNVRVERLNDISEADAKAEGFTAIVSEQWYEGLKPLINGEYARQQCRGVPPKNWLDVKPLGNSFNSKGQMIRDSYDPMAHTAKQEFQLTWAVINGKKHPWESNPWVWVIEFRPLQSRPDEQTANKPDA